MLTTYMHSLGSFVSQKPRLEAGKPKPRLESPRKESEVEFELLEAAYTGADWSLS